MVSPPVRRLWARAVHTFGDNSTGAGHNQWVCRVRRRTWYGVASCCWRHGRQRRCCIALFRLGRIYRRDARRRSSR